MMNDLLSAICNLKSLDEEKQDISLAVGKFMDCHMLFLKQGDPNGFYWSIKILQGLIRIWTLNSTLDLQNLPALLSQRAGNSDVESLPALAAYHAGCQMASRDRVLAEDLFMACLSTVQTQYMRYEAAMQLGSLLCSSYRKLDALKWFEVAKECSIGLEDSERISSYQIAKTLSSLGRYEEAVNHLKACDSGPFTEALTAKLDADMKMLQNAPGEQIVAAYTKTRVLLTRFMTKLDEKLAEYLGSVSWDCLFLLKFLNMDKFSKYYILEAVGVPLKEAEEAIQVERLFFVYQLYKECRDEMVRIQESFSLCMDPRPFLEHAIELLAENNEARALDSLVLCQHVALKVKHSSGFFWTCAMMHRYIYSCEKQGVSEEELFSCLLSAFGSICKDGENPEAWAHYHLAEVGGGKISERGIHMLKLALNQAKTPILGYYVTQAIGEAVMDVHYYILMKDYALQTEIEEFIVQASVKLFFALVELKEYEKAHAVHEDLNHFLVGFPGSLFGQAASLWMERVLWVNLNNFKDGTRAFGEFISKMELLPRYRLDESFYWYLGNEEDSWSHDKNLSLQLLYNISLSILKDHPGFQELEHIHFTFGGDFDEVLGPKENMERLLSRIAELRMQGKLEQAKKEAHEMLHIIENGDSGLVAGQVGIFMAQLKIALAGIACDFFLQKNDSTMSRTQLVQTVDELMGEAALCAPKLAHWFHLESALLLTNTGDVISALSEVIKLLSGWMRLDANFGSFSDGRIKGSEALSSYFRIIQTTFWRLGLMQLAMVWVEREHSRDLMYKLKNVGGNRESYLKALYEFDTDDDLAWKEIETISKMAGEETAILVLKQLYDSDEDMCLFFMCLLHNGKLVSHISQIKTGEVASVFQVLQCIQVGENEEAMRFLSEYYNVLIKPFIEELEQVDVKRIIFVPSEDLCTFPFSALMDEDTDKFLCEKYALTVVSSLRLLKQCKLQEISRERQHASLVVGNPTVDLLEASVEAGLVQYMLMFSTVYKFVGKEASKRAILETIPMVDWVHIASHGVVNADFPDGALLVATDEKITGNDIVESSQALNAAVVVLSACQTGLGRMFTSEGVLGLPRSFHISGVPSVVMSLWKVNDDSTKLLMHKV